MNKAYYAYTASLLIPSSILIPFTQIFHHGDYKQQMADHARIGFLSEANNHWLGAYRTNALYSEHIFVRFNDLEDVFT